jgi:hypothetical protein
VLGFQILCLVGGPAETPFPLGCNLKPRTDAILWPTSGRKFSGGGRVLPRAESGHAGDDAGQVGVGT